MVKPSLINSDLATSALPDVISPCGGFVRIRTAQRLGPPSQTLAAHPVLISSRELKVLRFRARSNERTPKKAQKRPNPAGVVE